MCNTNNIENVQQIVCALKKKFKAREVNFEHVIYDSTELVSSVFSSPTDGVYFYGILSVGDSTSVIIRLFEGSVYSVAEKNQIIELWESLTISGDDNITFRGYEITVK